MNEWFHETEEENEFSTENTLRIKEWKKNEFSEENTLGIKESILNVKEQKKKQPAVFS